MAWTDLELISGAGRFIASSTSLREVAAVDGVRIYENLTVSPRAFVVHDVAVVPDAAAAERALADGGGVLPNGAARVSSVDVERRAVVEAEPGDVPAELTAGRPACASSNDRVTVVDYGADEVRLEVDERLRRAARPVGHVLSRMAGDRRRGGGEDPSDRHGASAASWSRLAVPTSCSRYRPARFRGGVVVAVLATRRHGGRRRHRA